MSELLERLRDRDWRLTAQRRVIAEVFDGPHAHLTADEVHRRARGRLPEVSLATVYNTLNELVALGEVIEVTPDHGPKRYDPNTAEDHHHLVCVVCGEIRDVAIGDVPSLPGDQHHGYELADVEVTFRGTCPRCADRDDPRDADRGATRWPARNR